MNSLPSYRIMLEDGTSYVTSMAAGITLTDARNYFLGQHITQADESTKLVIAVEVA